MFTRYNTQKPVTGIQVNRRHPLARGLVGCWLFNEGSGNKVYDLSGNGNTGTFNNSPAWVAGKFGSAVDFVTASSQNIIISPPVDITAKQGYVSMWVRFDNVITTKKIFFDYGSTNADDTYVFNIRITNNADDVPAVGNAYVGLRILEQGGTNNTIISTTTIIASGTWYHIVAGSDGSAYHIWVNNIEQSLNVFLGANNGDWIGDLTEPAGTTRTVIGSGFYKNAYDTFLDGQIDNVLVSKSVPVTSEIALLYREPFCMVERDPIELWSATALAPPEGSAGIMTCNTGFWGPTF